MSSLAPNIFFKGRVFIKCSVSLEQLGELLSLSVFGGAHLGGREQYIYDEVPAIFMNFLGLRIVLAEAKNGYYELSITPELGTLPKVNEATEEVDLSYFIESRLRQKLKNRTEVKDIFVSK